MRFAYHPPANLQFAMLALGIQLFWCGLSAYSQHPGVRNAHGMVYWAQKQALLLVGGASDSAVLGDNWMYQGGEWQKLDIPAPPARTFSAMVAAGDYILLFGGNPVLFGPLNQTPELFNDTWIFKGGKWEKCDCGISPPARSEAAIAYDPNRNRVVLFGGYRFAADGQRLERYGDTWEFDGEKWEQLAATGPDARSGAAMFYDNDNKQVVLLGGNLTMQRQENYRGHSYTWNGQRWERLPYTLPLIFNPSVASGAEENAHLLFGGWNGKNRLNDSWMLRDGAWSLLEVESKPPARNHAALVYHPGEKKYYLFGGHDGQLVFGDLWAFGENAWQLVGSVESKPRLDNGH